MEGRQEPCQKLLIREASRESDGGKGGSTNLGLCLTPQATSQAPKNSNDRRINRL